MRQVFVDGQHGTAGLRLSELLRRHPAIDLLELPYEARRDVDERRRRMAEADAVALCLPGAAVRRALSLVSGETRVIDASNEHRCADGWVYGLPEMGDKQRTKIASARRVANPGCFATAFILAVRPLVSGGLVSPGETLHCCALTGYSAGGSRMIERYESDGDTARFYSLDLDHRHLPEMRVYSQLAAPPVFLPAVGAHREGMHATVSISSTESRDDILAALRAPYDGEPFIRVVSAPPSRLSPVFRDETNIVELHLSGERGRYLVSVRLHNLIKGAAGAAVQNLNLMLGLDETMGLE